MATGCHPTQLSSQPSFLRVHREGEKRSLLDHLNSPTSHPQDYTATIYLRQRWTDERLVFEGNKSFTLDARLVEFLWVPDTYIVESKTSFLHEVTVGNRLIRLFANGTVLYALRYGAWPYPCSACPHTTVHL